MTSQKFDIVPFHNHYISTVKVDDKVHVVMKPIVERLGLQWRGQLERIKNHAVLAKGILLSYIPSAGGEQEMVCLELQAFHGWLMTITPGRIPNEEVRATVLRYQEYAFRIVYEHFHGPLKPKQMNELSHRTMIELRRQIRQAQQDFREALTLGDQMISYTVLQTCFMQFGLSVPTMEQMRAPLFEDCQQDILNDFWAGVETVIQAGHDINHSRQNSLIALNLPELRRLFVEHDVSLIVDRAVTSALRQCESPKFVAMKPVNSKDGKVRECWVFAVPMVEAATIEG
jgi:hypothetical protein